MLSVSLVQLMSLFKGLQDKIGLWLMVALCILALLGSSAYFLVKSLIPPVPESIEIGQADAPSNRGKADYALMQALTARKEPVAWVFAGDSITHGCMHTDYLRNYQEHFTQALKATPERARDTVVNTGVSGATTRELMEYFNAWVADYQADVVFLCFGMNDPQRMESRRKAMPAICARRSGVSGRPGQSPCCKRRTQATASASSGPIWRRRGRSCGRRRFF